MAQLESMFGSPPEMVDLQIDQENRQWASRPGDAYQRMASAGSLAVQRGGTALGDAFGIVDPRKAMALKVQDALNEIKDSGVDLNQDPVEFYTAMSKAFASRGLMEQATQASMKAMELKDKSAERADKESSRANKLAIENLQLAEAQAKLELAKQKALGKPWEDKLIELIKTGKFTPASLDVFATSGKLSDVELIDKKDKWSEPIERNVNGKTVLMQQNTITGEWKAVAGNQPHISASASANSKTLHEDSSIITQGLNSVKPLDEQLSDLRQARALNRSDSPAASSMSETLIAKAMQSGTLSNKDIARVENSGDILERWGNYFSRGLTGKVMDMTKQDRDLALKILEEKARETRNQKIIPFRKAAERANYNPDDMFPIDPGEADEEVVTLKDGTKIKRFK